MKIWQQEIDQQLMLSSCLIFFDDPVWKSVIQHTLSKKHSEFKWKCINAVDVSVDWINIELHNYSLFSEKVIWNILGAEKLSPSVLQFINDHAESIIKNEMTLIKLWVPHSFKKKLQFPKLVIDKVPFWENQLCVEWFMKEHHLNPKEFQSYWPWDQELSFLQHWQLIEMVSMQVVNKEECKNYFLRTSFENGKFELLDLFIKRNWKLFLENLKMCIDNFEFSEQLKLINLLRSQVSKIARYKEQENIELKSQNDKKLFQATKSWNNKDILKWLKLFSEWEIAAKAKQPLTYTIAQEYIARNGYPLL